MKKYMRLKMKKCPECGRIEPEANFVKIICIAKSGLEYQMWVCYDCCMEEWED